MAQHSTPATSKATPSTRESRLALSKWLYERLTKQLRRSAKPGPKSAA